MEFFFFFKWWEKFLVPLENDVTFDELFSPFSTIFFTEKLTFAILLLLGYKDGLKIWFLQRSKILCLQPVRIKNWIFKTTIKILYSLWSVRSNLENWKPNIHNHIHHIEHSYKHPLGHKKKRNLAKTSEHTLKRF